MTQGPTTQDSMTQDPWYQDGLRFECTNCGDCCTGAPGVVWVTKDELAAIARLRGETDVEVFEEKYARRVGVRRSLREFPNGDCVFFDSTARCCQIYEVRPRQCRTWPFWDSNLRTPEAWQATGEACPGCNKGRLHLVDEIESARGTMRV
jgi:Fe-S-cluster containining protein